MKLLLSTVAVYLLFSSASAFGVAPKQAALHANGVCSPDSAPTPTRRLSPLFGRAAAVRAATKGETDAKKAKINALFGKRIIMTVKAGGSADPQANGQLGQISSNLAPTHVLATSLLSAHGPHVPSRFDPTLVAVEHILPHPGTS